MHPRVIALFYLFLFLGSTLAYAAPHSFADAQENNYAQPMEQIDPASSRLETVGQDTYTVISFQAATNTSPGTCRLSELSEAEVQRLKDSILTPGIVGQELSSGAIPNTNRDKVSDRNTLLIPNPSDPETAFQKEIPTQVLNPSELSLLQNQSISGPIAFGVSLDDSLRAARCVEENTCAASDELLQYRNSGQGIVGNVKDIYSSLKGELDKEDSQFSEDEAALIRGEIESQKLLNETNTESLNVDTVERAKNPNVMNHIRSDNTLQAGVVTNCDNGSCVVTIYSMFDKYFNSWFSGELVIGTFGPTVWGQFKKMLSKSKRYNLISSKVAEKLDLATMWGSKKFSKDMVFKDNVPVGPNDFFTKYRVNSPSLKSVKETVELSGADYFRNLKKIADRDADMGGIYKELFIDKKVTSGGAYPSIEDALFGPNGKLGSLTDFEKRKKIFTYTGELKKYADVTEKIRSELSTLAKTDRIQAARGYAKIFTDADDAFNLDFKEFFKKSVPEAEFRKLYVKDPQTQTIRSLLDFDDKYFDDAFESFVKKGDFSDVKLLEKDAAGIKLFAIRPTGVPSGVVDMKRLQEGGYSPDTLVRLFNGETVFATPANFDQILKDQQANPGGGLQYILQGGFTETTEQLTPKSFAEKVLAGNIMDGKVKNMSRNINSLYDTMVARDWGKGGYTNILSRSLQAQENLVGNYFKFYNLTEGGVTWTAKMYGYWWLTQGFGNDKFSIYQLPETWTEARFVPGEQDIYKDAYVDFFANEGSDTGDIFRSVISKFPAPIVLDSISEQYAPLKKGWEFIAGEKSRATPDNLAMYFFGSPACEGCLSTVESPTQNRFDIQYISPESVNSFFLEHGKSKEAKEEGQLLTLFAHHTNVNGKLDGEALDEINLVDARNDRETCEQVMEDLPVYGTVSKVIGAERVGAALAVTESVSYLAGGLMGTFVTIANQGLIAPKMNECVDDKEGYFASLYVPHTISNEDKKTETIQKNASQNALDGIRSLAEQVKKDNPEPSLTDKALNEATSKVQSFIDEAQNTGVAEADLRITGSSSGYLRSQEVIYFWMGGGSLAQPNQYNTEGKTLITDENGNTITLDNESGTLSVNGIEVISASEADHTRLANKNLEIPAVEIPQRINGYSLNADTNQLMLSINVRGESVVQDPALLDCIQSAVLAQSAVPLNSNNMTEAFGRVESVATDAFPNIAIDPSFNSGKGRILMGGQVSYAATGAGASVQIYGNRNVQVTGLTNPNASNAGKMNSILLENGSIIYKPQSNELLIWLRHHAAAIVSDDEVKDFTGTLTNTTNPANSCDEPAINLAVETDPSTPATKLKGDNLTAGLQKNGPFQVFETENKRFILYSRLVDGECKQFFKVIDKNTGEVYDQPIEDIFQNEDGTITIKTEDGLSHSLKFSDENGKPVLTYDGKSEVLRSASGKGGSFYYDPNKGMYYAENAQLIPLNENFKNQGVGFQANPDGTVSGKAGDNVFNINTAQGGEGLFNVPSLPETLAGLLAFVLLIGLVCAGIYLDKRNRQIR